VNNSYLFFRRNKPSIAVAKLSPNGLEIKNHLPNLIISHNDAPIDSMWHFKRGSFDFIIYSEYKGKGLKVARSVTGVLGPYETKNNLLINGEEYHEPSVIVENEKYHLLFGTKTGPLDFFLVDLQFDLFNWPYATTYPASEQPTVTSSTTEQTIETSTTADSAKGAVTCPVCPVCDVGPRLAPTELSESERQENKGSRSPKNSTYNFNFYNAVNIYNNKER